MGRLDEVLEILKKFNPKINTAHNYDIIHESARQFIEDIKSSSLDITKKVSETPSLLETVADLDADITSIEHPSLLETVTSLASDITPTENPSLLERVTQLNTEIKPDTSSKTTSVENPSLLERVTQLNTEIKPDTSSKTTSVENPSLLEPESGVVSDITPLERSEYEISETTPSEISELSKHLTNEKSKLTEIKPIISAQQNNDFFNQMEYMFDDITIDLLFIHDTIPKSFNEIGYKFIMDKDNNPIKSNISNKVKLLQIFNYFRNASAIIGGSLSLIDFKFLIKNKISEIRPKISQ
jgi:hypothetical protein